MKSPLVSASTLFSEPEANTGLTKAPEDLWSLWAVSDDSCQDMCWLFDRLYWFLQRGNPHISPWLWHTKLARLDLWGCASIIVQGHFGRVGCRGTEVENFRTSPHIHYHLRLWLSPTDLHRHRSVGVEVVRKLIIFHSGDDPEGTLTCSERTRERHTERPTSLNQGFKLTCCEVTVLTDVPLQFKFSLVFDEYVSVTCTSHCVDQVITVTWSVGMNCPEYQSTSCFNLWS